MTRERTLDPAAREQAALAWEAFHGKETAPSTEHREFGDWVRRSPEHVEAYLRVSRTMHALKSADVRWPETSVETLISEAKAHLAGGVVTPLHQESPAQARRQQPSRAIARGPWALALAAMLLIAIGAVWILSTSGQTFETRFGEQRFVRLDDGSGVTLNTASRIEVKLSKGHRVIRLIKGEALFDVAHDTSRPFDVYTGSTILRAVGTRFDVDVRAEHTTVTIVEGVVSLTRGEREALPLGNTPLLRATDRVVISASGPGAPQHGVHADEATAWTQQQLILKRRALGEVVEELNRYNRERIVVESPKLRAQEITGVFKVNDPASFLVFLSSIPGVRVSDDGHGGHVVTLDDAAGSGP